MHDLRQLVRAHTHDIAIIHYASSSIYESPVMISCITVAPYGTGQSQSYALSARSEQQLIEHFASWARSRPNMKYVGWNMGDSTFGSQVIRRRYEELTERTDFPVQNDHIIDLDEVLGAAYGKKYTPHPKLRTLAEANRISLLDFRSGADEVELFKQKRYREIELSTNRKTWMIHDYVEKYAAKRLVVPNRSAVRRVRALIEDPLAQGILAIFGVLLGGLALAGPVSDAIRPWLWVGSAAFLLLGASTYLFLHRSSP